MAFPKFPKQSSRNTSYTSSEIPGLKGQKNQPRSLQERFGLAGWDILGVLLLAFALMTLLAYINPSWSGGYLNLWITILKLWFGWGVVWIVLLLFSLGIWLILGRKQTASSNRWGRIVAVELIAFTSLAILSLMGGNELSRVEAGMDGGRIGWGIIRIMGIPFEKAGFTSKFWIGLLLVVIFCLTVWFGLGVNRRFSRKNTGKEEVQKNAEQNIYGGDSGILEVNTTEQSDIPLSQDTAGKKRTILPPEFRKRFRIKTEVVEKGTSLPVRNERLPDLSMLVEEKNVSPDERNINMTAGLIEKTFNEFGIPARVVGFKIGPTVTQFAVEPGYVEKDKLKSEGELDRHKVRVSQISGLKKDLALALAAERLRIEAPVPGRPYVGIEVPNPRSSVVRLKPILETEAFYKFNSPLTLALGRDVSGNPVVADLVNMPHLLIAGTTGSGKSVCIAALTTCLVMNNSPEDLRLVMIDPKMVELIRFNGLPHLYGRVETRIDRILGVLRWTVLEMERRYKILEDSRSRNIDTYNRKMRKRRDGTTLPHLVMFIDELADLMMSAPDQTEHNLVRLAQMARATGIHLVLATQRPSTDVVTGLIKANFPARISFAVASSVDSRVILDTTGAESLLGQGDMLFLPPEASAPIRAQGVMVSDQEVERVISFWQQTVSLQDEEAPPWDDLLTQEAATGEQDRLLEQAAKIVRDSGRASASLLQRRLRIGYPRAARLIDELEVNGVIGPAVGSGREREVYDSDVHE